MKTNFFHLSVLLFLAYSQAFAACTLTLTYSDLLRREGIDPNNPCRIHDQVDDFSHKCRKSAEELHVVFDKWGSAFQETCRAAEAFQNANQADCAQENCRSRAVALANEALASNAREMKIGIEIRKQLKNLQNDQLELASRAAEMEKKVRQAAKNNPGGSGPEAIALKSETNKSAAAKLGVYSGEPGKSQEVADLAKNHFSKNSDVTNATTPLVKEPLKIAQLANNLDKAVLQREVMLRSEISQLVEMVGLGSGSSKVAEASSPTSSAGSLASLATTGIVAASVLAAGGDKSGGDMAKLELTKIKMTSSLDSTQAKFSMASRLDTTKKPISIDSKEPIRADVGSIHQEALLPNPSKSGSAGSRSPATEEKIGIFGRGTDGKNISPLLLGLTEAKAEATEENNDAGRSHYASQEHKKTGDQDGENTEPLPEIASTSDDSIAPSEGDALMAAKEEKTDSSLFERVRHGYLRATKGGLLIFPLTSQE